MSSITTTTSDSNGTQRLLSDTVLDIRFVDVTQSVFANPDTDFTGYAADGFWYTAGVPDPAVPQSFKATWAIEGEGEGDINRGVLDRFPSRIFVITTDVEVAIIDADTLDLWMRFVPLGTITAGVFGPFLGDTGTELREADFGNGFLVVSTSVGIRIVDFRRDVGFTYNVNTAWRSEHYPDSVNGGLVNRNVDQFLDFSDITALAASPGDPHRQATQSQCSSVSISAESGVTLAAVGHPLGLTGMVLNSTTVSLPNVKEHTFVINGGAWNAVDDLDADINTPIFTDSGTSWSSALGVRIGDTLITDALTQHTITDIADGISLTLDPELLVTDSGAAYDIYRPVDVVNVQPGGVLYLAAGAQNIGKVSTSDWYEPSGPTDPIDAFTALDSATLLKDTESVSGLAVSGSSVFVSTNLGVYLASEDNFSDGSSAEYLYSAGGTVAESTYDILEGGFDNCSAVVVDPETGHVLVAGTDGATSVLTEIDRSQNTAFQFFDVDAPVNALVAYRNIAGPPDVEVE